MEHSTLEAVNSSSAKPLGFMRTPWTKWLASSVKPGVGNISLVWIGTRPLRLPPTALACWIWPTRGR